MKKIALVGSLLMFSMVPSMARGEAVLTLVGTTVNKPLAHRPTEGGADSGVNTRYDVVGFYPNADTDCSIYSTQEGPDYDGFVALYQGSFNPASPTTNFVAADDDAPLGGASGGHGVGTSHILNVPVTEAQNWYIVHFGFNSADEGTYSVNISCGAPATRVLPASDYNLAFTDGRIVAVQGGRFEISGEFVDFLGNPGTLFFVPMGSDESAIGWFFGPTNFEVSIKVVDGCGYNSRYWVFMSATTNVQFTIRVRDTLPNPDVVYTIFNPLGTNQKTAVTDINAFATCP